MSTLPFKKQLLAVAIVSTLSPYVTAEEKTDRLKEVVVSATRTEQDAQDVSSSISKVTSDDIEKNMATDVKEAVKYMPGVRAEGSGRFGMAGFNIRGMDGSRVKMMVDGVQQPIAYNPGASEQRKYPNSIEVDTLAEIEVNKGPSSSLYGSDALGGVVLMRTKNPDDVLVTDGDENRFGIKTGYSSADENFKTTATWAMRKDKLETLLMLTYADGSETKTHGSGANVDGVYRGAADPADKKLGNLLAKAFYQINDDHRIGTTVEYYDYSYDESTRSLEGYSMGGFLTYNDRYTKDKTKRFRVGFEHEWQLNALLADDLKWSLNYQDSNTLNENYDTVSSPVPSYNYGKRMRERKAGDQTIQFDGQANKLISMDSSYHMLTYGLSAMNNKFTTENTDYKYDQGTVAPGHTDVPDAKTEQYGLFVQDQLFLLDEALVLNAGLRYDYFNTVPESNKGYDKQQPSSKNDAFTGKLGAVYHLTDQYSVYGQISQGFKAPTVQQLYYFYDQGAIFEPDPNLKAERSISYEAGFRSQSDLAKYEIIGFFNQYDDFITTDKDGESGGKDVYRPMNLDEVEIKGVEFSSTALLDRMLGAPEGLYAKLSVTYTDGKDMKTGRELNTISPLSSVFALGYDNLINNWGGVTNLTMVGRKTDWQDEENIDAPGYAVLDVTAYYKPMTDLTLRAGLFNAFDTKYWLYEDLRGKTSSSTHKNNDLYTQPGRNWGISLEYMFQ